MSSSAGGLGLEKNVFTQNSSGTYFSSCEDKFPLLLSKVGSLHFLWLKTISVGIILYRLYFIRRTNILCDSENEADYKILSALEVVFPIILARVPSAGLERFYRGL